jgi:hypothetical protein
MFLFVRISHELSSNNMITISYPKQKSGKLGHLTQIEGMRAEFTRPVFQTCSLSLKYVKVLSAVNALYVNVIKIPVTYWLIL